MLFTEIPWQVLGRLVEPRSTLRVLGRLRNLLVKLGLAYQVRVILPVTGQDILCVTVKVCKQPLFSCRQHPRPNCIDISTGQDIQHGQHANRTNIGSEFRHHFFIIDVSMKCQVAHQQVILD